LLPELTRKIPIDYTLLPAAGMGAQAPINRPSRPLPLTAPLID